VCFEISILGHYCAPKLYPAVISRRATMPPKSLKRPREEEAQEQPQEKPKCNLEESPEENIRQYRMSMRRYHKEEVEEQCMFHRRCAKLLDDLVETINTDDKLSMSGVVNEYFSTKWMYQNKMSIMANDKRMLQQSRFQDMWRQSKKAAPSPVADKQETCNTNSLVE